MMTKRTVRSNTTQITKIVSAQYSKMSVSYLREFGRRNEASTITKTQIASVALNSVRNSKWSLKTLYMILTNNNGKGPAITEMEGGKQ